ENDVTIVEQTGMLAWGLENMNRLSLMARLKGLGIKTKKGYIVKNIEGKTAQLLKISDGVEEQVTADTIIFTCGNKSNLLPIDNIQKLKKIYIIGDAKKPRGIMEAIYEGELIAEDIAALLKRNILPAGGTEK
ncbi:MAG TPA: hypothetical protein PKW67_03890, partial [Syntrophomonadaceae bacterium]|nr:hypothetical protein [Syntrophomonadaceae bacterium]